MRRNADHPRSKKNRRYPSFFDLIRFAFFSGLTFLAAWIAGIGRAAYVMVMLVIAAALAYAILELVDYEIVKKRRRG